MQWLNGLCTEKQQPIGMDDWHRCDGSTALAAKSNNQWGAKKANVGAKRQMGRQKANGAPKGKWGAIKAYGAPKRHMSNGVSLWERQCTQDKAMKPIESGNEPVALGQMKGNEPVALKPIETAMNPWH